MPICFIFNYFYPICLLAPSKCCKPPCLCSRADMQHPTMENAGRAERQSSQWLGKATDPLEHRTCRSQARVAPRLPAGQLTTSAPAVPGTKVRNPSTCTQPTAVLAAQAGSWPAPLLGLLPESLGSEERNGSLCQSRDPFLWGQDCGLSAALLSPPPLFFNKWKQTRRAQCLLSKLLYFTNLFQPPSQLFPCQQLYHCAIPLPTHKCTGWRYEQESLR